MHRQRLLTRPRLVSTAVLAAGALGLLAAASAQESRPAGKEAPPAEEPAAKRELPSADPAKDGAVGTSQRFIEEQEKKGTIDRTKDGWKTRLPMPPKFEFAADRDYFWNLRTNKGDIRIKLMPDVAPMHVSSTIFLSRLGFYDGIAFHRVITGFMAQGGDPLGNGTGGPGYKYAGEFSGKVRHDRPGLLSMANAGPGTDGSQFFLTFVPTPHLDGRHTIFGEIVEGMDVLRKLEAAGSPGGPPKERLLIEKTTISFLAKPAAEPQTPESQPADK